jgi:hypothetical protein
VTIKTLKDTNRIDLNLDRYDVYEVLPSHYDEQYPNLANFLKRYYESLELDDNPAKLVNDLLTNRDVVSVQQEFLSFLSNELLLGKSYFEQFKDKRTALQFSNLLYRSKGTEYSIQQFFRIFYNIDVDVFYGRDFVFNVGAPISDHLEFPTQGSHTGSTFKYTFAGAPVDVFILDSAEWMLMRQDVDYIQNFTNKKIEFFERELDDNNNPIDGLGYVTNALGQERKNDLFIGLAETGYIGSDDSDEQIRLKLITDLDRKNYSAIGPDATQKRITDDKFYQLFAIMIQTPVSTNVWLESYKTFVHPAGMYLAGKVQIVSIAQVGIEAHTIIQVPDREIIPPAKVFSKLGTGLFSTDVTERAPGPYGYEVRTRVNDMLRNILHNEEQRNWWDEQNLWDSAGENSRLLIGSRDSARSVAGWGRQYNWMNDADDINSRTLDDTYITLSNTINTIDENVYIGQDSDGLGNPWLPGNIDIRPEPPIPPTNKSGEGELEASRSTVVGVAEVETYASGTIVSGPSLVDGSASILTSDRYLSTESELFILTEDSDRIIL